MKSGFRYFYGRWPDTPVPEGVPEHLFYEVDVRGAVPRMVERDRDGRAERKSLELEGGPWGDIPSLVEMDWDEAVDGQPVEEIAADVFEREWSSAVDKVRTEFYLTL